MKYGSTLILFFLSLLFSQLSKGQNFQKISNKEGFNQNTVFEIVQDHYGFLWFATPNGLISFDGHQYTTYTGGPNQQNSISDNYISALFIDKEGLIWIGNRTGLDVYAPSRERFVRAPIPGQYNVNHIADDPSGRTWVSSDERIFLIEASATKNLQIKIAKTVSLELPSETRLSSFLFTKEKLLLATNNGLFEVDYSEAETKIFTQSLRRIQSFKDMDILTIKEFETGYWIGTDDGIFFGQIQQNDFQVIKHYKKADFEIQDRFPFAVFSIFLDNSGNQWFGTQHHGLIKYDLKNDVFTKFQYDPKNSNGISSTFIYSVFQDNFDVIWLGTAQGGINKLDLHQKPFFNYQSNPFIKNALSGNLITSILEDSNGYLWVSNYNNSLDRSKTRIDKNKLNEIEFESLEDILPVDEDDVIRQIYEDDRGIVWIGTDKTILYYNRKKDSFTKANFYKDGKRIELGNCYTIQQVDDKRMFFGGNQMVLVSINRDEIDKAENNFKVLSNLKLIQDQFFCSLKLEDKLLVGSEKGLVSVSFENDFLEVIDIKTAQPEKKNKLVHDNIFSLLSDRSDTLWIGTFGGGLHKALINNKGDVEIIEYFNKSNLLPDDAIYGILESEDEFLWITTDMGISRLNKKSNTSSSYDVRDGLLQNNFRQNAYHKGKSGTFYAGGLNGLTIFDPKKLTDNINPPNTIVTKLYLNNREVSADNNQKKSVLKNSILDTDRIEISENIRSIGFYVVVQQNSNPFKNKFAYKLEGLNSDWIYTQIESSLVNYTNLNPGQYYFITKAENSDGVWSEEKVNLEIIVNPAWYNTWWSYLLFISLIISFFAGVSVYFIQMEKIKNNLKFETLDKERMKEINLNKLKFFTDISHEFRTPLSLISGPIEKLLEGSENLKNSKYLQIIEKNTKRLLFLVDQLVNFRMAEQGVLPSEMRRLKIVDFTSNVFDAFENYAEQLEINFSYIVKEDDDDVVMDVNKIERIIFNFLSNAFKHTPKYGSVTLSAETLKYSEDNHIQFKVVNTGEGIQADQIERIFQRFYQVSKNKNTNIVGGLGLAYCKTLADHLGGKIEVESEPKKETAFTVTIPYSIDANMPPTILDLESKSFIKDWIPMIDDPNYNTDLIEQTEIKADRPKILLVEDEKDIQDFIKNFLSEKYLIEIANSGTEAFNKVIHFQPELIISDVMMNGMNGFELCKKLKSDFRTNHLPIILITALTENDDLIKGLELGADDYIGKPFSPKHLELRIEKFLKKIKLSRTHYSKSSHLPEGSSLLTKQNEKLLRSINKVIEENLSNSNFGVEKLSSEMQISASHFYRKLKGITGQSPNTYIRNYRLNKAMAFFSSNEVSSVKEAMYMVGIESKSYFTTAFKKLYGKNPSEFIQR